MRSEHWKRNCNDNYTSSGCLDRWQSFQHLLKIQLNMPSAEDQGNQGVHCRAAAHPNLYCSSTAVTPMLTDTEKTAAAAAASKHLNYLIIHQNSVNQSMLAPLAPFTPLTPLLTTLTNLSQPNSPPCQHELCHHQLQTAHSHQCSASPTAVAALQHQQPQNQGAVSQTAS